MRLATSSRFIGGGLICGVMMSPAMLWHHFQRCQHCWQSPFPSLPHFSFVPQLSGCRKCLLGQEIPYPQWGGKPTAAIYAEFQTAVCTELSNCRDTVPIWLTYHSQLAFSSYSMCQVLSSSPCQHAPQDAALHIRKLNLLVCASKTHFYYIIVNLHGVNGAGGKILIPPLPLGPQWDLLTAFPALMGSASPIFLRVEFPLLPIPTNLLFSSITMPFSQFLWNGLPVEEERKGKINGIKDRERGNIFLTVSS